METITDDTAMRRALDLARRGVGKTWPNPMVGAVIVRRGRIVGEGWHHQAGGPHAEILALRAAGRRARGGTLYLTLEPCTHFGKTPPCAPVVAAAGLRRVVVAMRDPDPRVQGRGLACLRRAGLRVDVGLLRPEASALNEVWLKRIRTGLPFVVCKAAVSLDGKIACASGQSRWITGPAARRYAHRLRAIADAVIVGGRSVNVDDPRLNVRGVARSSLDKPWRVILEGVHPVNRRARIFRQPGRARVILATSRSSRPVAGGNVETWRIPGAGGRVDVRALLKKLAERGASYVLVEGGGEVHAAFLGLQSAWGEILADEVQFIFAPRIIGGRNAPGPVGGLGVQRVEQAIRLRSLGLQNLGPDILIVAKPMPVFRKRRKAGGEIEPWLQPSATTGNRKLNDR